MYGVSYHIGLTRTEFGITGLDNFTHSSLPFKTTR
jgi:hypothetical protein